MAKNFIDLYIDFTKEFESPTSFWKWSAYSILAAILRDNVYYVNQEAGKNLYLNIFALLVAPSGGRKDAPIGLAESLVGAIKNTKMIAGRTSIEALSDILATSETSSETGFIIKGGSCILIAPELSAFFVKSDSLIPVLTDMYSYKEEYQPHLVGRTPPTIRGLCITMFGGANETMLKEVYSMLAISGGTLRRTFIIKPDERRPPNPLFEASEDIIAKTDTFSIKELLTILAQIAKLKGTIKITRGAAEEFQKWYCALHAANGSAPDPAGVRAAIHTGVKKIAAILAVSETMELVVDKRHLEESISECMSLIPNYDSFVMSSGKGTLQEAGAIFLQSIWNSPQHNITKRDFLSMHWGVVDDLMMERIEKTFESAGYIKTTFDGPNTIYTMTDKGKSIFSKNGKKEKK